MSQTITSRFHGRRARLHPFDVRLADEAACKDLVELLFLRHRVEDVSRRKSEQKNGTDFFLHLSGHACEPIRCENKFETHATGRLALEWVSIDRPQLKAGWMVTSRAAWLLSWFRKSGDLVAMPLDEVRTLVLDNPARHQATTARNGSYLSWNTLENVNWLLLNVPNARMLDLTYELGEKPERGSMVYGAARRKLCTVEELVELMARMPVQSTPLSLSDDELVDIMRKLQPVNRLAGDPDTRAAIEKLPSEWGLAAPVRH